MCVWGGGGAVNYIQGLHLLICLFIKTNAGVHLFYIHASRCQLVICFINEHSC